jgi:hypothetical protein
VAEAAGADGNQAVADAAVFQYLFRVVPG